MIASCRNIDRVGGLDEYLLSTPERELDSDVGLQLRQHIQAALRMRAVAAVPDAVAASPAGPVGVFGALQQLCGHELDPLHCRLLCGDVHAC